MPTKKTKPEGFRSLDLLSLEELTRFYKWAVTTLAEQIKAQQLEVLRCEKFGANPIYALMPRERPSREGAAERARLYLSQLLVYSDYAATLHKAFAEQSAWGLRSKSPDED